MNADTLQPSELTQAIAQQYRDETRDSLAARNSHLADPETLDILLDAYTSGLNEKDACAAARLHPSTVTRWAEYADLHPESAQARFVCALKRAKASGKLEMLKRIRNASEKPQFWTAAAWTLERTDPEQFALRKDDNQVAKVIVQIGGIKDSDVQINVITAEAQTLSPTPFASDALIQGAGSD